MRLCIAHGKQPVPLPLGDRVAELDGLLVPAVQGPAAQEGEVVRVPGAVSLPPEGPDDLVTG